MPDLPLTPALLASPYRYLFHVPSSTAILSDLHLGAEAELSRRGILMPNISHQKLQTAWQNLTARLAAEKSPQLIIAGDLFDTPAPDPQAIQTANNLLTQLPPQTRLTIIPGNHDPANLQSLLTARPFTLADHAAVYTYTIFHGHNFEHATHSSKGKWQPTSDLQQFLPQALIAGHQHPAVTLSSGIQSAKMICFATCTLNIPAWDKKLRRKKPTPVPLILLPPFTRAPLGSNLSRHNWILDLPYPADANIRIAGLIEPANAEPQVLDFGPLNNLRLPF